MTREILFRGKRVDTGEWVYGHYTQGNEDFHYITNPNGSVWQVDPSSIGEFTGLHDKDGNRIFEGDVRKDRRYNGRPGDFMRFIGEVVFRYGKFCLQGVKQYSGMHAELFGSGTHLGNIHDNPELLKP